MGCGGDSLTQPPAALPVTPGELTGPTDYVIPPSWNRLTAIGCVALGDSSVIGAVGVPISPSHLARYDCRGVPHDSVARTVAGILSTAAAADGRVTMMEFGTWELINYWQECSGESDDAAATYENGIWVLPDIGVSCTTWYEYQWVPEEGGGGEPPDTPPDEPPGGGGGSGGGAGSGSPPENTVPPQADADFGLQLLPPDCDQAQVERGNQWWCAGAPPTRGDLTNIQAAIARLHARGGVCAQFADTLDAILARGMLHVFPTALSTGNYASRDSTGSYIAISDIWTGTYYDAQHPGEVYGIQVSLQFMLAHEVEHLIDGNGGHLSALFPGKLFLAHTQECSDVGVW
jgi:hypothetical protein